MVRVMRGTLKKGAKISTTASNSSEVIQRIYAPLADEYREVDEIKTGNIAVCAGLKATKTGDLLISNAASLKSAKQKLSKHFQKLNSSNSNRTDEYDEEETNEAVSRVLQLGTNVPDAVYFCSVEPASLAYQNALEQSLAQLQREDPSLRVRYDPSTMQTVLGGMGELHLEIVKSRLLTEYKLDVDLGPLQIAYKETLEDDIRDTFLLKKDIGGAIQEVSIEMSLLKGSKSMEKFK